VLEGDAGIGKTTLWRAGLDEAHRRGLRVLASSPSSSETPLSFIALADLLGEPLDEVGDALPAPQRGALEVALLREEPTADSGGQRTVAPATLTVLRSLARNEPLLLAIDDVQWLDEASLQAIAFAVRRLGDERVSVLAGRRLEPGQPDAHALVEALEHRHGPGLALRVGPLSVGAVHVLVQEHLDVTFPRRVLERVHATSDGNPFYALELARALLRRSRLPDSGDALPVSDSLHELVRERLDAQPRDVQDLLAVVAALPEATLDAVELLGGGDAVDAAAAAGLLEVEASGRLRFTHPLLASAAYARVGPQARRALHERLATVVEGEERARHLALAARGPSAEVAATLHEAARDAAARGAIGTAAELAEQAVRLTPPDATDDMTQRRLDAAAYQTRDGDTARARAHMEPLLRDLPPGPARAGVLLRLARLGEHGPADALRLCRQAIDEAQGDPRLAEAHQLAAEMSMLSGDVAAGLEHARIAVETARAAGDQAVLIESLGTLCHYETYTGAITPGLLEDAVVLERQAARPSNNYSPREILGLRLMYGDRLDAARELLEESYAAAGELGDELDRAALLVHLTQLECRAGRLDAAEAHARECVHTHEQAGWVPAAGRFVAALASAYLGRVDEARDDATTGAQLAAAGGSAVFNVLNLWALGLLELSLGNHTEADRHLRELPERLDAMGYSNPGVRPVYPDAIEARIGAGDLDVEGLIDELERRGRALDNPWACATALRCRGFLRAAHGDLEAAIEAHEAALTEHDRSPQPLERGRTLLALGATLRRAKRRREARERLTAALDLFDALGAPLWSEKAAAELARIPGRTPGATGLTETEQRIAGLAAEGLTNKEIAARVFVTVRTVETNLSKVYAKLGVRSRTELATRLSRSADV
jgi:DNA-binding CsgD family transcriptional regulator